MRTLTIEGHFADELVQILALRIDARCEIASESIARAIEDLAEAKRELQIVGLSIQELDEAMCSLSRLRERLNTIKVKT